MIRIRGMKAPKGKNRPFYEFHGSDFGPPTTGEQVRRGVLLATVAAVLIVVGLVVLFVWLDMTSKIPIGPVVIILGTVLLILSMRQFWIVWKNQHNPTPVQAAPVHEEEEIPYGSMMEMDSLDSVKVEKCQQDYIEHSQLPQLGANPCFIFITPSVIPTNRDAKQAINSALNPQQDLEISQSNSSYHGKPVLENNSATESLSVQQTISSLATPNVTAVVRGSGVRSCCDLSSESRLSSTEVPNPPTVINYSQGPILVKSILKQKSLAECSTSPQHSSHQSLSVSLERTDVVETI